MRTYNPNPRRGKRTDSTKTVSKAAHVMSQSAIINHRQHVGLQKVSALAGMLHSSLGPDKKYKFVQDDTSKESVLVNSCYRIIENLEPTCAVSQLVYETLRAHHQVYHTGSGCLLFLAGAWSRAALECLQKGISVTHIISAMSEGMDICVDVCKKSSVPFEDLTVTASVTAAAPGLGPKLTNPTVTEASQASCHMQGTPKVDHKTLKSVRSKLKLSRHFCETECEIIPAALRFDQPELPDVAHIATTLSHGCNSSMKLAVEAIRLQWKTKQEMSHPMFDITKVVTCVFPGLPEDCACVVPGFVVLLSNEQASIAHQMRHQHLKVAFIVGDLSHTHHHLGYKSLACAQRVSECSDLSGLSGEDRWLEKVVKVLLNLEVNLILSTGFACEKLIHCCFMHHILVVENVKSNVLRTFAKSVGAVPATYITQLHEHCVGTGLQVTIWRDLQSYERKSSAAVNISTSRNEGLVTVIIASTVHGKLQALEDQFWACAHRLQQALKDRRLLPGAGGTEMLCIQHLLMQAQYHSRKDSESVQTKTGTDLYKGVVLQLMAEGLRDYIITVMVNTGRFSAIEARTAVSQQLKNDPVLSATFSQVALESEKEASSVKTYDNLSVKQEAWRKALDLVFLVLQTDAEVITYTNQTRDQDLMLL